MGADRLRAGLWRIAITGAGGWMGLATLELLRSAFGARFPERVACFGSSRRILTLRDGFGVEQRPLAALASLPAAPTLVLHFAFLTQEKLAGMSREDYIGVNRAISDQVIRALDPIGATAVFVASSGAVYLADCPNSNRPKALYGRMKRDDEERFASWALGGDRRSVAARIFGLTGPYINKGRAYALACFIADALAGRAIAIEATHLVYRSYVPIGELMSVVFGLMTESTPGAVTFDTAGDREYEMGEIARLVGEALGRRDGVRRPALDGGAADRYVGDGTVYRSLRRRLGVEPVDFADQVRETARFMAQAEMKVP